jgi:hypothetical protein
MSFELFVWLDGAWSTTGRRFKTLELAESAGKSSIVMGLTKMHTPEYAVRDSSREPNA